MRGAVRSAEYLPDGLKSSVLNKSLINSESKLEVKRESESGNVSFMKVEEKAEDKLPPIHRYGDDKFKPSSSRV